MACQLQLLRQSQNNLTLLDSILEVEFIDQRFISKFHYENRVWQRETSLEDVCSLAEDNYVHRCFIPLYGPSGRL